MYFISHEAHSMTKTNIVSEIDKKYWLTVAFFLKEINIDGSSE